MKIRTITTGFNLRVPLSERQIQSIADFTRRAKQVFEDKDYEVQTTRIVTQPWERYFQSRSQMEDLIKDLEGLVGKYGVDYFNIGTTLKPENISGLFPLLKKTSSSFCSVQVSDGKSINQDSAQQVARLIKRLSRVSQDGFTNLRFAALFNVKPGSPFFPAAYHKGSTLFAIGTENSDLVYKAFTETRDIQQASLSLKQILTAEYRKIEKIASYISKREQVRFGGIDVSLAPSISRNQSLAFAFEKLGLGSSEMLGHWQLLS